MQPHGVQKTNRRQITHIVFTHLFNQRLVRWCCAPGAKHKEGVSSALCLFSLWILFEIDVHINVSNSSIRFVSVMMSEHFTVSVCSSERETDEETCSRGRKVCTCVCEINLINFTAALSHRPFHRRSEPPTSKTKANVENCSNGR